MKKQCSVCKGDKLIDEFPFKNKALGIRQGRCKQCVRNYGKRHYQDNKQAYAARATVNRTSHKIVLQSLITEYLLVHPCIDCGEPDPVVLDFDHRAPEHKRLSVSTMVWRGWSWETILREIEKCDVRCSNCHRRKTAKDRGFYKLKLL